MTTSHSVDVGIYSREQLRERGIDRRRLRHLLDHGRLLHIARGWYARPDADTAAVAALRSGTRLTCLAAARLHGLWLPERSGEHVYARRGDVPAGWVPHGPRLDAWPEPNPVASLPLCLDHAARCLSPESAAILFESALTRAKLTTTESSLALAALPLRISSAIGTVTPLSQSGSETRVARWLRGRGVRIRQQVSIRGIGTVDILVGGRWIIEVDSQAHHTSPKDYENDRRRDMRARLLGYEVTRLSYDQVWQWWAQTQDDLADILASRRHLRLPRALRHRPRGRH
ncbi:type IV toxin-antitoxin system AbiEi family antitoxin domain-containing protein [Ruania rhizosphaerae]|uniref:type IV toxin-antitoxin system AbiEi family antitoxin domain-containing protein n=1 Tax=Ruania rhizosphaerae TaxID=1840413 RepID=UPI0013599755|nr:type IV toxin-antitoxin system AbiEi family antitoxin domain-containing protein [Ruania rhizosphaerae]